MTILNIKDTNTSNKTSEKYIEKNTVDYAKQLGFIVIKNTSNLYSHSKGIPDRIFIKNGYCLFVEFKSTGKKPTKLQENYINKLNKNGTEALVVDNLELGKKIINDFNTKLQHLQDLNYGYNIFIK